MKKNIKENMSQFVNEIPKTEIHIHLEGSIQVETLFELIKKSGDTDVVKSIDELRKKFIFRDFAHFLELWQWKDKFIKNEKDFEFITYNVLKKLHSQNVKYTEMFFSPDGFKHNDLSIPKIVEYVISGRNKAFNDFGIESEFICDFSRNRDPQNAYYILDEIKEFLNKGIIGVGLGGPEIGYPAEIYTEVFKKAEKLGFRKTAHAGETEGPHSVWNAIKSLDAKRIGHGVRAIEDPELIKYLRDNKIPLEVCPVSNIKTRVYGNIEQHPIKQLHNEGLLITLNSDDPEMFNTSINNEYKVLIEHLNFGINDIKQLSLNGIEASFMLDEKKHKMYEIFENEWSKIIDKYDVA